MSVDERVFADLGDEDKISPRRRDSPGSQTGGQTMIMQTPLLRPIAATSYGGAVKIWVAGSAEAIAPRRGIVLERARNCLDNKLYLTCLWPGLPELWWRGRLSALPTAVAFAFALNVLVIARFIYPEWLAFSFVRVAGWAGVLAWFYCTIKNVRELPGLLQPRKVSDQPDRFADAQFAFLRSDWPRAEMWLKDCLAIEERDPPALLLLAGVYRHTGQFVLARGCIETLRTTEAADRWWLEVDAEEKRLLRDTAYHEQGPKVSDSRLTMESQNPGFTRAAAAA